MRGAWIARLAGVVVVGQGLACTPRTAEVVPAGPGFECGVDLVNNTGDVADAWYEPGPVRLGTIARNEAIYFEADCGHRVLSIYGQRNNPLAGSEGNGCSSAEARLRPGKTVMVSLNAPRVPFC